MSLPKELGSLNDLKEREKKAFDRQSFWHSTLDDVYEFFLPNRNLFESSTVGQKKMERIFDSTALEAIQQGASKLQENIAPIWSRWATFAPSDQTLQLLAEGDYGVTEQEIKDNLEKQAIIVFDYLNRSNFATQFYEHALDLLVGTGTLRIDENQDNNDPIIFSAIPQKGIAFEEGPHGKIETHWRRFKVKARNLERQWAGFKPSKQMAETIKQDPNADVEVSEGVVYMPRLKHITVAYGVKTKIILVGRKILANLALGLQGVILKYLEKYEGEAQPCKHCLMLDRLTRLKSLYFKKPL